MFDGRIFVSPDDSTTCHHRRRRYSLPGGLHPPWKCTRIPHGGSFTQTRYCFSHAHMCAIKSQESPSLHLHQLVAISARLSTNKTSRPHVSPQLLQPRDTILALPEKLPSKKLVHYRCGDAVNEVTAACGNHPHQRPTIVPQLVFVVQWKRICTIVRRIR